MKPDQVKAHLRRADALRLQGRLMEALESYERGLIGDPTQAQGHLGRGRVQAQLRRFPEALGSFDRAIVLNPRDETGWVGRASVLYEMRQSEVALSCCDRALTINPACPEAFFLRGCLLGDGPRVELALQAYDQALSLRPDYAEAHSNRGILLYQLSRFDQALESFDAAVRLRPRLAEAHTNRGIVLQDLGRFEEALASFDHALVINPDLVEAHSNRGHILGQLQRMKEAIASYDVAIAKSSRLHGSEYAGAHYSRSMALLLTGDFENGWQEHEWRWRTPQGRFFMSPRASALPCWLGQLPIAGKTLLLRAEQGLGDTLQFCRYAPILANMGARVLLEAPGPLQTLLRSLPGVERVVVESDPDPEADFFTPIMSLPLALKTTESSIPSNVPYLKAEDVRVRKWAETLGRKVKPRVGIVWSGGFRPNQPRLWSVNRRRNVALEALAPLRHPEIEFYSLQKGQPAESELAELNARRWIGPDLKDHTAALTDFAETAALIENLDLVISVDTSTAHLTGALGKPVWLLNRFDTCWRWMQSRTDSPWYPTLRLYRQTNPGDWDQVVGNVATDLHTWVTMVAST
jgi:tetratricopeptide (TPR) repeat protein